MGTYTITVDNQGEELLLKAVEDYKAKNTTKEPQDVTSVVDGKEVITTTYVDKQPECTATQYIQKLVDDDLNSVLRRHMQDDIQTVSQKWADLSKDQQDQILAITK